VNVEKGPYQAMLKCRDIAIQASDYIDGEMNLRQRLSVGVHLLLCGRCRTFIRHMRLTIAYCQRLPAADISSSEAARITDKVIESQNGQ